MKRFEDIEVSKLVKAKWNYKEENDTLTNKLLANIKKNGQVENLLIREIDNGKYEVVNGNHRLDVMNKLKMKTAHVYNFGKISLTQAKRIAIETNETKFESDTIKLAEVISELSNEISIEELTDTLPYSEQQIQDMRDLTSFDFSEFEDPNFEEKEKFDHTLTFNISKETHDTWLELRGRFNGLLGYDNESKVFEFAIIEALNIPIESIK